MGQKSNQINGIYLERSRKEEERHSHDSGRVTTKRGDEDFDIFNSTYILGPWKLKLFLDHPGCKGLQITVLITTVTACEPSTPGFIKAPNGSRGVPNTEPHVGYKVTSSRFSHQGGVVGNTCVLNVLRERITSGFHLANSWPPVSRTCLYELLRSLCWMVDESDPS